MSEAKGLKKKKGQYLLSISEGDINPDGTNL